MIVFYIYFSYKDFFGRLSIIVRISNSVNLGLTLGSLLIIISESLHREIILRYISSFSFICALV